MFQRSAAGNGEIRELQFWYYRTKTNSVQVGKFIGWVCDQPVKIGISFSCAESGGHTVPDTNQKERPFRPRFGKQVVWDDGACRTMPDRVDKTNKQVKKYGPNQNNTAPQNRKQMF
jgi:hypothetical protein